jgi:hypothetical protein
MENFPPHLLGLALVVSLAISALLLDHNLKMKTWRITPLAHARYVVQATAQAVAVIITLIFKANSYPVIAYSYLGALVIALWAVFYNHRMSFTKRYPRQLADFGVVAMLLASLPLFANPDYFPALAFRNP